MNLEDLAPLPMPGSIASPRKNVLPSKSNGLAWPIAFVVVGLCIAVAIYMRGSSSNIDVDPPPKDLVQLVADCTRVYVASLAEGQDALADEVAAGAIVNQEQFFNRSEAISKAARKAAYMPLAELENETLPKDQWGPEQATYVAEHLRKVAQGQREAIGQ